MWQSQEQLRNENGKWAEETFQFSQCEGSVIRASGKLPRILNNSGEEEKPPKRRNSVNLHTGGVVGVRTGYF